MKIWKEGRSRRLLALINPSAVTQQLKDDWEQLIAQYIMLLRCVSKNYCPHISEWDIPPKITYNTTFLPLPLHTYGLQRGALACTEFTCNIIGYSFSVVSSAFFSVDERTIIQMSRSGSIILPLSFTQTLFWRYLLRQFYPLTLWFMNLLAQIRGG